MYLAKSKLLKSKSGFFKQNPRKTRLKKLSVSKREKKLFKERLFFYKGNKTTNLTNEMLTNMMRFDTFSCLKVLLAFGVL